MNNPLRELKPARIPVPADQEGRRAHLRLLGALIGDYREFLGISRGKLSKQVNLTPQALLIRERDGMFSMETLTHYAEALGLDVAIVITPRKAQPNE